jgi:hypothetical protein
MDRGQRNNRNVKGNSDINANTGNVDIINTEEKPIVPVMGEGRNK